MRILIIFILIGLSQLGMSQMGIRAYQIRSVAPLDSFYVMVSDSANASSTYGFAKWMTARDFSSMVVEGVSGMDNWLLAAEGTGGTETIIDGETVTFNGSGITTVTRTTNNIDISSTEAQTISYVAGTDVITLSGTSSTVDLTELNLDVYESNVLDLADAESLDFLPGFDAAPSGTQVDISLDISEFGTDADGPEGDEVFLTYDASTTLHELFNLNETIQDLAGAMVTGNTETGITVTYQDADGTIDFVVTGTLEAQEDGITSENPVTIIDIGDGFDWNPSSGGAVTLQYDFNEFATDATEDANEYVILWDTDGANPEKRLVTAFGADGNGIFDAANDGASVGNSTFDVAVPGYINFDANTFVVDGAGNMVGIGTVTPVVLLDIESATANVRIKDTNGGTGNTIMLISDYGAGTGITGGISFQYDATEQYDIEANKRSSTQSTLTISGEQATDAEIVYEKNADLQDNTTESILSINGGVAYTQNYEWTATSADLTLDRSYYSVIVTGSGAVGDEILLPNVFSASDNWASTMTTTDCQVGQEYVITNFRASSTNLIVRTNSGDFIDGTATTTITVPSPGSVIIKCVRLNGTTGYWMSYD